MGISKLRCPDCKNGFEITHRIDEYPDEAIPCPHCGWTISTILFDFVSYIPEEEEKKDA